MARPAGVASSGEGHGEGTPFAALPSVAAVIGAARDAGSTFADPVLTRAAQDGLALLRRDIATGSGYTRDEITARVVQGILALERPKFAGGINATGVVVHTNLGRAAVSDETAAAMTACATGAIPLELD
ncbi:MAG: hypothetical protein ACR2J8_12765, partial [Thermomicrobiales bacterium]